MPPINITDEGVRRSLKGLNAHKAAGPDNLKPIVLKELADIIVWVNNSLYEHLWGKSKGEFVLSFSESVHPIVPQKKNPH